MRGGALDFVEYTSQMRHNHHAQLYRRAGSHAASLVERRDHPVQGIVLAKEENVVLSTEVVVKICRRKGRGRRNVAHAGLRKPAQAKLFTRGAQDLQAPREVAPSEMAIALTPCLAAGHFILQRSNDGLAAGLICLPSVHLQAAGVKGF